MFSKKMKGRMNMKMKKALLTSIFALALGLAVLPTDPASAACANLYVDNDDPNYGDGDTGTWDWVSAPNSERDDHRIHHDSADVYYYWQPKQSCSSGWWTFGVHLYSASFNNTQAWYYKNDSPTLAVNQDTAIAGYTNVESVYLSSGTTYTFKVKANAPTATMDTGADMIRFID
jgi:hypothetical protein